MTAATATTALEAKDARLPRLRRNINRLRAGAAFVAVWAEVWPLPLATIAVAAHRSPLTLLLVGCTALITWRAWRTGALAKNITDTIATIVRLDWRNREIDTWQLPHLIAVRVSHPVALRDLRRLWRYEGRHSIPAEHAELVVRPNNSQGSPEWEDRFCQWASRRYGFESYTVLPAPESINCLSVTLRRRAIPDYVGS